MIGVTSFFDFARERYGIHLARMWGEPAPWTQDPILQEFRFCNIFREDDRVTKWFRQNVRGRLTDPGQLVFSCVAFRFFNTIRTGEQMIEAGLFESWSAEKAREALGDLKPLVTGAYMVKTPIGVSPKLEGLIEILDPIWRDREVLARQMVGGTLEQAHNLLMDYPWVGPFMAYEAVTDLRHTPVLKGATDILSWASAGPGAMRGLQRVQHGTLEKKVPPVARLSLMRELLECSRNPDNWPAEWPQWEMREVEHTLCEFDKYERTRLGEGTPKQKYRPQT